MKKTPSSSKKPRRSKSSLNRLQRKQQRSQSSSGFDYQNLEERLPLDASFVYDDAAGTLDFSQFRSDVTFSHDGNEFTAVLDSGVWDGEDPTEDVDDITFNMSTLTLGSNFLTAVNVMTLGANTLTFDRSTFDAGQSVSVDSNTNFDVNQIAAVDIDDLSVVGNGTFILEDEANQFGTLNVDVTGDASVVSRTSIDGDIFSGDNVTIVVTNEFTNPTATYNEISGPGDIRINVDGDLTVVDSVATPSSIQIASGQDVGLGDVGTGQTDFIDIEAASISAASFSTTFTSVANDINSVGKDPETSIRLRATGGSRVIGVPGSDAPIARDNSAGGIEVTGNVVADQILLQSSNGIIIPADNLDTLYLYLGGDLEEESRGEFQLNVPSLQQLSVNLYDGFAITSQQDLTIGDFKYTGVDDGDDTTIFDEFDDQEFTGAYGDLYANLVATSLIFDTPFQTQKLVADITTDIEQNAGAVLEIDDLYISAKRVVLDNVDNDFQRIAAVGKGFLADDRQNNEDILTIRDKGTLEIAVLDSQPDDALVVNFGEDITLPTLAGIRIAGQVDIQTGLGGPAPIQPVDAVEPTSEQLGNTAENPTQYQIERFEIPRDRTGTQTGVFRDDNYNGAERPVYYIEFVYDGTQDLRIETDQFERGNPERVRGFIDIELALYDSEGKVVALGDDVTGVLDRIEFAAGGLPAGRYFVAASAFSTEFEDDFVVKTSNVQTGTLNVTITGNTRITPETSRDLTQAVGAPLIVLGGDEPVPDDELFEENPDDFTADKLVQLDPDADDFVPERRRRDPIGDLLPEVDGRATLGAANGGSVQLGQVDANNIRELVVSEAETVEFVDANNLTVTSLSTPGQTRLAAGRGGDGELSVGDISAPKLLLQASSGVTQEGVLTTDDLLLGGDSVIDGGGDFVILSDTLENLAFNLPAGNLALTTSQELTLAFQQYTDAENLLAPRFIFNDSMVSGTARIEAASITVNTRVEAETLVLNAANSIVQEAEISVPPNFDPELIPSIPSIVADSLSVSAETVTLDQPRNEITRLAGNVTGTGMAFNLVNRTPIVFATIDNTVEAITRLRPIGVTQNFGPLETINGLTVAGMADIVSGLEPDDPTANPNAIVTINPVVVSNDDGSNTAEFFGDATQEAEIKRLIDVIYLQAEIDVEWLPTVSWNNTFANIGDGTVGDDGERPRADLGTIVTTGDAAGVGSPDPNVIDMYAVQTTPGNPPAIGLGFLGFPGNTIEVIYDQATADGRAQIAMLAAHEIGHNLGLGHVDGTPSNLMNPFVRPSPPPTLNADQAATAQASALSSEPAGIRGGFTQEDDAPLNIGTANFTVRGDGDIILLNPENDVTFVGTDARDVSVALVDGSVVTDITANRNLLIEGAGSLTVENANSLDGSTTINAEGDVLIGSVTANATATVDGTITITSANGSINDLQTDLVEDLTATGTITLSANSEIGSLGNRLDFADEAVVNATSATSNIAVEGVGDLTLQNFEATVGSIDVVAGDVLVGAMVAGQTIDINSADGINDLQDDLVADFTASGLVNLVAVNEIGGMASPQVVDTGGRLEAAPGTVISATTTNGTVAIGGDGELTFQDLITSEAVDITTTGDLTIRNLMAFSAILNAGNDLTVDATKTVDFVDFTSVRNMDLGTVMATEITLTSGGTLDADSLMASTGDIIVNSTGDANISEITADLASVNVDSSASLTAGTTTAANGDVQLNAAVDLTSTSVTAETATFSAGQNLVSESVVTTVGAAVLTATGSLTSTTATAATDATLTTTNGDLTAGDVTAAVAATLTSGAGLTATNVSGQTATITAAGVTNVTSIDTVGATIVDVVGNATLGTVTADSATLTSGATLNTGTVTTVNAATLSADDIVADTVVAGGAASLTASQNIDAENVTGGSVDVTTTFGLLSDVDIANATAITGDVNVDSAGAIVAGTVTADNGAAILTSGTELTATTVSGQSATITARSNATVGSVTTVGDATVTATGFELIVDTVDAGGAAVLTSGTNLTAGTVTGSSATLDSGFDLVATSVTATTGDASLTSAASMTVGTVSAVNGAATFDATGDLNVTSITSQTATATVFGNAMIDSIETDGATVVDAVFVATVGTVDAGTATLTGGTDLNVTTVTTVGDATLTATGFDLTADTVNAGGAAVLTAGRNIDAGSVTGESATLDAGFMLDATSVTAAAGDASLTSGTDMTVGSLVANGGAANINADGDLTATSITGQTSAIVVNGVNTNIGSIDTTGLATLTANWEATVGTVNAGDAVLTTNLRSLTITGDVNTTGNAQITSADELILQNINSGGDVVLDADNDFSAALIEGASVTITSPGTTDVAGITAIGAATVDSAGNATIGPVVAGSADLSSQDILTTSTVTTTGSATLNAGNDVIAEDVNAGGPATVTAGANIQAADVTGSTATLTAGGTLSSGAVTATTGNAVLSAQDTLTSTTVTSAADATLTTTNGDLTSGAVTAANNAALTSGANLSSGTVTATGGSADLNAQGTLTSSTVVAETNATLTTATGDLNANDVTSNTAAATLTSGANLTTTGTVQGDTAALTAAASLTSNIVETVGLADLDSAGLMNAESVIAGSAELTSADNIDVTSVVTNAGSTTIAATGSIDADTVTSAADATLTTTNGDLTAGDVTAAGAATLNSAAVLSVSTVDAGTAALSSVAETTVGTINTVGLSAVNSGADLNVGAIFSGETQLVSATNLNVTTVVTDTGTADLTAAVINAGTVTAQTNANLTSTVGDITVVDVTSVTGVSTINSAEDLFVTGTVKGQDVTLIVAGVTDVEAIDIAGFLQLDAQGITGIRNVTAGSADLNSTDVIDLESLTTTVGDADVSATTLTISTVDSAANATLFATQGNLTTGSVAATGTATLAAALANVTATSITANAAVVDAALQATVTTITTDAGTSLQAGADGRVDSIDAGFVTLNANQNLLIDTVTTTFGSATLTAREQLDVAVVTSAADATVRTTNGTLFADSVTAAGNATLASGSNLISNSVTAASADLSSVTLADIESVTTTGLTTVNAGTDADIETVVAGSANLTAVNNLDSLRVTATTGDAFLAGATMTSQTVAAQGNATLVTTTGTLNSNDVTATNGQATLQSAADLISQSVSGNTAALSAATTLTSNTVQASGLATLTSVGLLDSESVVAGSATLTSDESVEATSVVANVDSVVITAKDAITAGVVDAQGAATLTTATGNLIVTDAITSATDTVTLTSGLDLDVNELDAVNLVVDVFNNVALNDVDVEGVVDITGRRNVDVGNVIGSSVAINAAATLAADDVTARTGDVSLTAQQSIVAGAVAASAGAATLESGGQLVADTVNALTVTTDSVGNTRVSEVATDGVLTMNSGGVLNVTTANASSAALTSVDNATFGTVSTTGDTVVNSTAGKITADDITSTEGAVSLTAGLAINALRVVAPGDVTFDARGQINSAEVRSTTGSASLTSNSNLNINTVAAAVDATLNAPRSNVYAESVTAGNAANLNAGAFLFTRTVNAATAMMTAGTNQTAHQVSAETATITAQLDLRLNDIEADDLTLIAGDDIFDIGFGDDKRVKTGTLSIVARNSINEVTSGGIVLDTDVDFLSARVEGSGFGNIIIREFDAIELGDITAGNGRIYVAANGTISGGSVRTVVQNDKNDIRLEAIGDASDIRVDSVNAGNLGDVTLLADDDIVITGAGAVKADYVFAAARNRNAGGEDGIRIGTDIVRTDMVVGLGDPDQLRGDLVIEEANDLTLNFARTLLGKISVTANGTLVANVAQAENVTDADSIRLKGVGTGSDVVTGRVVVRNQTGGVVIEADDDIRDSNSGDNQMVVANAVTYIAGNNVNDNFNGIIGQSRTGAITARVNGTSQANIFLFNQGFLRLNEATLSTGTVSVVNEGSMLVSRAATTSNSPDNLVRLKTDGAASDLLLVDVDAGTGGRVVLDSADDIFDTDSRDALFVKGGFLSATSRNGNVDAFDGIILNVDVDRFVADAQNGGQEVIRRR